MGIVGEMRRIAFIVTPVRVTRVIHTDPDDDHVLACAIAANADLIVSGDADLQALGGHYLGIPILTPGNAVRMIEK